MIALLLALGCTDKEEDLRPPAQPGPLMVGIARTRMPLPIGIGTVGNAGFGSPHEPSPFAELYPATTRLYQHPDFRVAVISRGEGFEQVWLRSDTIGVFQQFRRAVVAGVRERIGKDIDDALIFGATHTHSGPGRLVPAGGVFDLIADEFLPEFYDNLVQSLVDTIEAAYADLQPGRIGTGIGDVTGAMNDRRCEDSQQDHVNPEVPLVALEQNGVLKAVLVSVPIHGTVLGIDDLTLSQDVSGGIERALEDSFAVPVQAMMFNSWGGDMSPATPDVPVQSGVEDMPSGFDQIDRVGQHVAGALDPSWDALSWTDDPVVRSELHHFRIDRDEIGYADGEFAYEFGGVFCGAGFEEECDPSTLYGSELDDGCIPFTEEYPAPLQTAVTVGRLADLHVVTWPGEPGTRLAESLIERMREQDGVEELFFVGYAQDYTGYALHEEDWWQGGYEASGSVWGPRQGEFLLEQISRAFALYKADLPVTEPDPLPDLGPFPYEPWLPTTAINPGTIADNVHSTYRADRLVSFTVRGLDPWHTVPYAELLRHDDSPVLRTGGHPVDSDGNAFWIDLQPVPGYGEAEMADEREFLWTFNLPPRRAVVGAVPELAGGSYKIRVTLPDGTVVTSAQFTVNE